jgi:hypothetical protein
VPFVCRLVGSVHPVELMNEKGRRFESNEVFVTTVAELFSMNPHLNTVCALFLSFLTRFCSMCANQLLQGKKFRTKITIDGVQPHQGWWFMSCDACNWKAVEEGAVYRCSKDKCGARHASPRLVYLIAFFWVHFVL